MSAYHYAGLYYISVIPHPYTFFSELPNLISPSDGFLVIFGDCCVADDGARVMVSILKPSAEVFYHPANFLLVVLVPI